jgi:nucleotide-binding universal stress UspA family protein
MRVLIGYDGSDGSRAAINDLARAGLSPGTSALILTAVEVAPLAAAPMMPAAYPSADPVEASVYPAVVAAEAADAAAHRIAREGEAALRALFPDWTIAAEMTVDAPGPALVARAASWNADLVVVGSHGHSRLARLLLGSVSQMVVAHAPCSTRVVRAGAAPHQGATKLLLAIDTSPNSAMTVEAVSQRSWPAATQARVVTVMDPRSAALFAHAPDTQHRTGAPPDASAMQWARHALDEAVKELIASGLETTSAVRDGDATHELLAEASQWPADCIFLGAKGHSRLERLLLGSVSSSIAAKAHCSVEIVRSEVA